MSPSSLVTSSLSLPNTSWVLHIAMPPSNCSKAHAPHQETMTATAKRISEKCVVHIANTPSKRRWKLSIEYLLNLFRLLPAKTLRLSLVNFVSPEEIFSVGRRMVVNAKKVVVDQPTVTWNLFFTRRSKTEN